MYIDLGTLSFAQRTSHYNIFHEAFDQKIDGKISASIMFSTLSIIHICRKARTKLFKNKFHDNNHITH